MLSLHSTFIFIFTPALYLAHTFLPLLSLSDSTPLYLHPFDATPRPTMDFNYPGTTDYTTLIDATFDQNAVRTIQSNVMSSGTYPLLSTVSRVHI